MEEGVYKTASAKTAEERTVEALESIAESHRAIAGILEKVTRGDGISRVNVRTE